jgi:hypothetical protein
MIHINRHFQVSEVLSIADLVESLTEHTWTLCTAFRLGDILFLNDSFSEDGAQEYTVVRNGREIESVTFSWQSRAEAHNTITWLVEGGGGDYGALSPILEGPDEHRCPLCA